MGKVRKEFPRTMNLQAIEKGILKCFNLKKIWKTDVEKIWSQKYSHEPKYRKKINLLSYWEIWIN